MIIKYTDINENEINIKWMEPLSPSSGTECLNI